MRRFSEPLMFVLAALVGWNLAARWSAGPSATSAAEGRLVAHSNGAEAAWDALDAARRSVERGRFASADEQLRHAWMTPQTRELAANLLRRLHARPDVALPVDEEGVRATRDLLGPGFFRHETEHFVVLSDAGRDWTVGRAGLLERTYDQFFRVMDRLEYPAKPPRTKLLCVLFEDHAMYAAFARTHDGVNAPWVAGYYAGKTNRIVFYDDHTGPAFAAAFEQLEEHESEVAEARSAARDAARSGKPDYAAQLRAYADDLAQRIELERRRLREEANRSSEAKTIHEAIHLLAFNCGLQSRARSYPFWVTEGLAAAFETNRPRAAFGPDHMAEDRYEEFLAHLEEGVLLDLEAFVSLRSASGPDEEMVDVMYSQAYALFVYLFRYERRSLGDYLLDFWAEPPGRIERGRQRAMFEDRFGPGAGVEHRLVRRMGGSGRSSALARP